MANIKVGKVLNTVCLSSFFHLWILQFQEKIEHMDTRPSSEALDGEPVSDQ